MKLRVMHCAGVVFACFFCCLRPAAAITGGAQTDGSPRYHVVFIQDANNYSCTGTALTRELVLIAAQCVDPDRKYKLTRVDSDILSIPINVTRVEPHPDFDPRAYSQSRATADLALLKLATPLPLAISAPLLGYTVAAGDQITIVGYGVTATDKSPGTLRVARLVVTGKPGLLQIRLVDPATGGERAGLGGCNGDSGAPAIHTSSGRLVGVVVWSTRLDWSISNRGYSLRSGSYGQRLP